MSVRLTVSPRLPATAATTILGILATEDADSAPVVCDVGISSAAHAALQDAIDALRPATTVGAITRVAPIEGIPGVVLLVGLGDEAPTADVLRRASGSATLSLTFTDKEMKVALALPSADVDQAAAIAQGALSGCYRFTAQFSKHHPGPTHQPEVELLMLTEHGGPAEARQASVLNEAVTWCRDLVNTAPNLLFPQSFTDQVVQRFQGTSVHVKVWDEQQLRDGGFGGLVGVGQGSARPPRLLELTYRPSADQPHLALVGKGITFDTGGISIKPAAGMSSMKHDMAGAAAVAATLWAAQAMQIPHAVTGYLCLAENMPGGNAQRPGDVVTMRNGMTVEVLNTDAEGRMVLADGISLACEAKPGAIVDIATLTGACVVALGHRTAGVMGNDQDFIDAVLACGGQAGESLWPLPLPSELRANLDSPFADLAHIADRWGATLQAGLFLQEFVSTDQHEVLPWAHLDIAGPAYNEQAAWGATPKGGTGFGVATLFRLIAYRETKLPQTPGT